MSEVEAPRGRGLSDCGGKETTGGPSNSAAHSCNGLAPPVGQVLRDLERAPRYPDLIRRETREDRTLRLSIPKKYSMEPSFAISVHIFLLNLILIWYRLAS